jgi:Tol biopolymer transport system component
MCPDGREIAYMAFQKDGAGVYRLRLNSTSSPERVIGADTGVVAVSDWTNDGTRLIWKRFGGPTNDDVMVVSLSGAAGIASVVSSAASENAGKLSPDGRWLAFSSDESGRDEVYIQPFPQGGRRWQVSRAGGTFPRWRADGRELFFYTRGDLSAAELTLSDHPRVGAVTTLFSFTRRPANVNDYPYAVTPDGQRFLVNVRSDRRRPSASSSTGRPRCDRVQAEALAGEPRAGRGRHIVSPYTVVYGIIHKEALEPCPAPPKSS